MLFRAIFLLTVAGLALKTTNAATDKVICYHGSWSYYRSGNGKFTLDDVDTSLCTHLIYSFVGINTDGTVRILDTWLEENLGNLAKAVSLKKKNTQLKVLVAIGGWSEGSINYSTVAASESLRTSLINSAIALIEKYGFDGFDIDWEYPAQRGGAAADKTNYVSLLKEFRAAFDKKGLILTAAVAASSGSVDLSYDVPSLSKYLDVINVMAYDLHGSYDGVTGQNAPLYASSIDVTAAQKQLNVDACIKGWISRGAAPEKLALGLGAYGRSYTLSSSSSNKLGAPVSNAGNQGPYTAESGMLGYHEIVELQKAGGWTEVWDDEQKVPYTYKGNQWVGYDNPKSIAAKVNYAKDMGLGGVMLWSIETEDFKGISGTKYPLLNAVKEVLGGSTNDNTGTDNDQGSNTGTGTDTETDSDSGSDAGSNTDTSSTECTAAGYISNPSNCSKFYQCVQVGSIFVRYEQSCPSGLVFNGAQKYCDWPANVSC